MSGTVRALVISTVTIIDFKLIMFLEESETSYFILHTSYLIKLTIETQSIIFIYFVSTNCKMVRAFNILKIGDKETRKM